MFQNDQTPDFLKGFFVKLGYFCTSMKIFDKSGLKISYQYNSNVSFNLNLKVLSSVTFTEIQILIKLDLIKMSNNDNDSDIKALYVLNIKVDSKSGLIFSFVKKIYPNR